MTHIDESGAAAAGTRRVHRMPFGAQIEGEGVRFRLWAPDESQVRVRLEPAGIELPMRSLPDGWHELLTSEAGAGTRYRFVLGYGLAVPDPASRFQPEDVHGPSQVIDPADYAWRDDAWRGRPWVETVLYELHVGTFTPEGTFRAAMDRLDHLVSLGVTAIELMPVGDFPGAHNWGYDGVLPFAPDAAYGRPEDMKALVDAAHAKGLSVFLDVIYNHFGPEGNFLAAYARRFFTARHKTPWGDAVNYDGADARPVREFAIENALYWLREFHLDGLRLDAVHAIIDDSAQHVLSELAARVRREFGGRHVHLVLENAANQSRYLLRDETGAPREYAAQWNDDVHHALHVASTGERDGYYAPYASAPDLLARSLAEGFAFQGEHFAPTGTARGEASAGLPPTAFVSFLQNHDQIGNRALGERLVSLAPMEAVRAVAAIQLLSPQIPLLFMGEEWGASTPFPFFADFGEPLAEAVRTGRREEFASFPAFAHPEARERIPDPISPATFASARLDWSEIWREPHATWLAWYRRILAARREEIVPRLAGIRCGAGSAKRIGEGGVHARWTLGDGSALVLCANLSPCPRDDNDVPPGRVIWSEGWRADAPMRMEPWGVVVSIEPR